MINVFFPYYNCGDELRQKEIDLCLKKNIENADITRLIVLIDDGSDVPYSSDKVLIKRITQRPTYRLWIELSKELQLDGISLLCNSDIYFDETLPLIYNIINAPDTFLALSRWELENDDIYLHKNPHWSQDAWAFHMSAEFSPEMLTSLEFSMGVPRCDNKIAYLFCVRGWRVFNPCHVLKSIHVHETQLRTYHKKLDDRIVGAIAYIYPSENPYEEVGVQIDIWSKRSVAIKKVGLNKALERWIEEAKVEAQQELPSENDLMPATSSELLDAMTQGNTLYSPNANFKIITRKEFVFFSNLYTPEEKVKLSTLKYHKDPGLYNVLGLIPPVIKSHATTIGIKPKDATDVNFWQYPCATEKQAFENHLNLRSPLHVDPVTRTVNTYVPLPWATYIDKKTFPDYYIARIKSLISAYHKVANENGFTLKVHTVCQHIHWIRILNKCAEIGITDLHLSHKDSSSYDKQKDAGTALALHGWPLIAVNYEVQTRSAGMERKPIKNRRLLASFIGAHMTHYRNDDRVKLFDAAKLTNRDDIFVDLGNEWHFNKLVYEEQVLNKKIAKEHISSHDEKTFKYNSILSDSRFSLCPEGAGPNTLRFWESIAVGSIPVIFSDDLAILKEHPLGKEIYEHCVLWPHEISPELFVYLDNLSLDAIQTHQKELIALYEKVKGITHHTKYFHVD